MIFITRWAQKPVINGIITSISRVKKPQLPIYFQPFIRVITPFITGRGPTLYLSCQISSRVPHEPTDGTPQMVVVNCKGNGTPAISGKFRLVKYLVIIGLQLPAVIESLT